MTFNVEGVTKLFVCDYLVSILSYAIIINNVTRYLNNLVLLNMLAQLIINSSHQLYKYFK